MQEAINAELLKLQEELGTLDTAVKEISKAGKVSEDLINSTQEIHQKYSTQLNKVQTLYSEFLNKTYHHTEKNVSKIFQYFQEKIKEEEKILEKYTELSLQTEDLTHEYLRNSFAENKRQINELIKDADKNFEGQRNIIDLHAKGVDKKLDQVVAAHEARLEKEEKILSNYLELAQMTAELTEHLKTIDFPERLDGISSKVAENHQTATKQNDENTKKVIAKTEELLAKIEKQEKRTKRTNTFLLIILIMNVVVYSFVGYAFFSMFGDFFTTMFGN